MRAERSPRGQKSVEQPRPLRAGRPRDPNVDRLLLEAALSELTACGYADLSVDKVASKAGVGKPTVYRRYKNKKALTIAALNLVAAKPEIHMSGDVRADLTAELSDALDILQRTNGSTMVHTLLAEMNRHPELLEMYRQLLVRPRAEKLLAILKEGQKRGEVHWNANLPMAIQLLFGAMTGGFLMGDQPSKVAIAAAVNLIIDGIGK